MTSTLRNGASTSNPILVHQPTLQYTRPSLTRTTGVVTIIYFCLLLHLLLLSRHRPGLTNIIYLSEGEDIFVFGSFQRLPRLFQSCNSKQIENEWVAIPAIRQNHGNGLTGRRTSHTRVHDGKEKSLGHIGLFWIVALWSQPGTKKISLVTSRLRHGLTMGHVACCCCCCWGDLLLRFSNSWFLRIFKHFDNFRRFFENFSLNFFNFFLKFWKFWFFELFWKF